MTEGGRRHDGEGPSGDEGGVRAGLWLVVSGIPTHVGSHPRLAGGQEVKKGHSHACGEPP